MRDNLYNVYRIKTSIGKHDLSNVTRYLNESKDLFLTGTDRDALFKERTLNTTPMAKVFSRLVDDHIEDLFSVVAFSPRQNANIPSTMTYKFIPMDMLQVEDFDPTVKRTIQTSFDLNKKIILNASQMVRTDGRYYYLKDQDTFHSTVVRDTLSRSYYVTRHKTNWLKPTIATALCRIYTLLLSSNISRNFDIHNAEQDFITVVFATYFFGMICDNRGALGLMSTKYREFYLRDRDAVVETLDRFKEILGHEVPESLDECLTLLNSLGVERLKVSRDGIASKLRTVADDLLVTSVALEYPPFFLWAVINALSGSKNQLSAFIDNQRLKKDAHIAIGELVQAFPALQ